MEPVLVRFAFFFNFKKRLDILTIYPDINGFLFFLLIQNSKIFKILKISHGIEKNISYPALREITAWKDNPDFMPEHVFSGWWARRR